MRERPFISFPVIHCGTPPLDRYSFPSGHTLHAVCFTTVLALTLPALALVVLPFTLAVAASRVVLGLHYPSDVLAGALVGGVMGVVWVALGAGPLLAWFGTVAAG
ncbi:phosphatase PAP2 family protein [Marinobacter sp. AN1]|uniref:phosphatase PAP2 family protein n=1 Tax=Marinobacter sp. AN1 TaxID=2886046 RepID=UPI00222E64F1|nr:phosphatase PAP2 family protein [Marinobacter sp. AN1]UZD66942.1 phosphatase PAP2 family protein [Marinobacter sp. AN1]